MKIAVIGSGVSGLAATWLLNEHSDHEVYLFEADDRAGGHANTVNCQFNGVDVSVDTGFMVFKPTTYPNFARFLSRYPAITVVPTQMTFSVSKDHGLFEWVSGSPRGLFCQPSRLLDPSMWRLFYDILRFNACARELVVDEDVQNSPIGAYLAREGYSDTFRDDYLTPMIAAIWRIPPDECLRELPAQTLARFMSHHGLLQITGKRDWWTIQGGSRQYVDAILDKLPKAQLHLSTPITSVARTNGTVQARTADGRALEFDRVIMACHSDVALALLRAGSGTTAEEEEVLGRFTWNRNDVVLHSDVDFMPNRRSAWSSWNYLSEGEANGNKVALTYNMNLLQHLPASTYGPVLVTLNPPAEPARGTVSARFQYDHPVLNAKVGTPHGFCMPIWDGLKHAIASMRDMGKIQGRGGILYAGAWLGYGFHEDGFTSGLRAAAYYIDGIRPPFEIASANLPVHPVFVAHVFQLLEWSGVRHVLGSILACILGLLGRLILLGDLGHGSGSRSKPAMTT